jgi:hypothetical protein
MATSVQLKQGDTAPLLTATLVGTDGVTPQPLTGATVTFSMKVTNTSTLIVTRGVCTLVDAPNGKVKYAWLAADTATAGTFDGEFEVTFADLTIMRFPNDSNFTITITPKVG